MRVHIDSRKTDREEDVDVTTAGRLFAELGEVVAGRQPGRQSAEEIARFKSGGLAMQDVLAADSIHRMAASTATVQRAFGDLVGRI